MFDVSERSGPSRDADGPTSEVASLDRWRAQEPAGRIGAVPAGGRPAEEVLAGREASWLGLLEECQDLERDERLADLDDDELTVAVGRQAARVAAATAQYLRLVAEVMARGVWADHGARTPAHWLSHEVGVGTSTAKDHVRVAVRLRGLPRIRERFEAGRISYTKVRAITRIAVPELEPLLLAWCEAMTGAEVERTVRGFRRTTAPGGAAAEERHAQRSWRRRSNGDGTSTLTIVAPDEEIDELEQLCQSAADLDRADTEPPSEAPLAASAEAAAATGPGARRVARADDRGGDLVAALVHLTAAGASGEGDSTGLDRWTLNLHVDVHDLAEVAGRSSGEASVAAAAALAVAPAEATTARRGASAEADTSADQVPVWSTTGRTRTMSAATLRRLACEAGVVLVVDGPDGTPLDVGRRRRDPTVSQRRALLARDRGCRFPGCGATRHLHAHHVVHWGDDGPTDLANLVTVCAFHHRFVHERRWQVTPAAAGTFRFTPPHGPPLPTARPLPAADDAWTYDPAEDAPLRPRDRHGDELDLHYVVEILHQQLRQATGTPVAAAA